MVKPIKIEKVDELKQHLSEASSMVLTDYRGLDVSELSELRRSLSKDGVTYAVVKNTLARRAATEAGVEGLVELLEGPTAIAFGGADPIAAARLVHRFTKEHKSLEIKGGYMDGQALSADQVITLAKLPGREQLLSTLAGVMQAPIAAMARVLNAPMQGFAVCLNQIAEKQL